jgi:hypothetical protein
MALVERNGRPYRYRSVRRGGRVTSEYLGSGLDVALIEGLEAIRRERAEAAAADQRGERRRLLALARAQAGRDGVAGLLVHLVLERAGFHRRRWGPWRRRRRTVGKAMTVTTNGKPPAPARTPAAPREEILDVMKRVAAGDQSARPRFLELFDADPEGMVQVCGGNLAALAEESTAGVLTAGDMQRHALAVKMAALRAELAGPEASPVVRLLAERVALAWLDAHCWDILFARVLRRDGVQAGQAEFFARLKDRAGRRYVSALKSLAAVQKLAIPTSQVLVNVAGVQQINTGGGRPERVPENDQERS